MKDFQGKWALVTGASSGIGAEFARQLAALGTNLIVTARRENRLEELSRELQKSHGIEIEVISCDLTEQDAPARLFAAIEEKNISIDLLINNAGFGVNEFAENADVARIGSMIRLNVGALTELTYLFLPKMLERKSGAILNVASLAAFQPVAHMPVYAATKAYVLHMSEALWAELRPFGITVTALCPGFTHSEFFDIAEMGQWERRWAQQPSDVVRVAIKGMRRRRASIVSGWMNWFVSLLPRISTRHTVATATSILFRPEKEDAN